MITLVLLWRGYLVLFRHAHLGYVYYAFETRVDSLAIGCLPGSRRDERIARPRHPRRRPVALAPAADRRRAGGPPWTPLTLGFSAGITVDSLLIALLIAQLLVWRASPWWRWLDARPVRYIGTVSYPMYLWHGWVIMATRHVPAPRHGGRLVMIYGLSTLVATGSWILLERPLLRLRRRAALRWINPA